MAEQAEISTNNLENAPEIINDMDLEEPQVKKPKLDTPEKQMHYKLEERLNGILCCAVCLDLPPLGVFQVCKISFVLIYFCAK